SVWPADDFPRTSLLKVRRGEVVGAVRAGATSLAKPAGTSTALPDLDMVRAEGDRRRRLQLLAQYVVGPVERDASDDATHVEDLGLSSLDAVELLAMIEGIRSRHLPQLSVTPSTCLADLHRSVW